MLDRLKRDGWVPYAKSIGTAAVAAVVLAVSAVRLVVLGEQVGTPLELRWTLPVALDVGGVVATVVWTKSVGTASRWGMGIALLSLGESLVGNVLSDLIEARLLIVTPMLVIGVGAVYPITLFLMIHLLVVSSGAKASRQPRHAREPRQTVVVREPVKAEQPKPTPAALEPAPPKVVAIDTRLNKVEQGYQWFAAQVIARGGDVNAVKGTEIDEAFGTNDYLKKRVTAYRARYTAEHATAGTAAAGN